MTATDPLTRNAVTVTGNSRAAQDIVFVHGFGTEQSVWGEVAAAFADQYRLVLFDNVGAGRSLPEAFVQHRYLGLHQYASDLLDIGSTLQLRDAILVGHSLGAMIGVLAAIKVPARFAKLVLIGASPRYLDDGDYHGGFTMPALNDLYQAVMLDYAGWADRFASSAMANEHQPNLARRFAATMKTIPKERALTVLCSIFQSDHRAEVSRIDRPTLLIQASDDIAVPLEVAEFLHRTINGSRLTLIDATGHLPHVSAPQQVIAAMRDFLAH